jgi:protein farnesyltransferase subunit beta
VNLLGRIQSLHSDRWSRLRLESTGTLSSLTTKSPGNALGVLLPPPALLRRSDHIEYLSQVLSSDRALPRSFACLNAGRPWVCYWVIHSLYLLGALDGIVEENKDNVLNVIEFLRSCQHETLGGFGGGPGQLPHLATTYAAVSALVTLGTVEAIFCD